MNTLLGGILRAEVPVLDGAEGSGRWRRTEQMPRVLQNLINGFWHRASPSR